jgi:hypothetical protein
MNKAIILLFFASSFFIVTTNVHAESTFGGCYANGTKSICNLGHGQSVTINNEDYNKYYLSENEYNNYVCNANGNKSICAQGDNQTLTINGMDMAGKKVEHDEKGNYILYR